MKYSFSYIISLQFLGFRFSGWQKQTNAKTLHDMVDKTLSFVLVNADYKTIGIGRTDAKVSANTYFLGADSRYVDARARFRRTDSPTQQGNGGGAVGPPTPSTQAPPRKPSNTD